MTKKFLIVILLIILFSTIFILWNKPKIDNIPEQTPSISWSGHDLSCAKFSCSNSKASVGKTSREFVPYHPCLVRCTNEYQIFESGQFAAIVPIGYDLLAQEHLQDLQYCFPLLKDRLGLTPFYNKVYVVFPLAQESKAFAAPSSSAIYYYRTKDQLDSVNKRLERGLSSVDLNSCLNAHELTHIFTGELNLPRWANEGIATYMTIKMPDLKDKPSYCSDDGLRFKNLKGEQFIQYSDLSQSIGDTEESNEQYMYETASCVFDYIAKNYGEDKVKLILKKFAEYAAIHEPDEKIGKGMDRFSSEIFIKEGIVPVVGEEIKADLEEMFNL